MYPCLKITAWLIQYFSLTSNNQKWERWLLLISTLKQSIRYICKQAAILYILIQSTMKNYAHMILHFHTSFQHLKWFFESLGLFWVLWVKGPYLNWTTLTQVLCFIMINDKASSSKQINTGINLASCDSWFTTRFWIFTTEFFIIMSFFTTR